jgi:hypothetical protein
MSRPLLCTGVLIAGSLIGISRPAEATAAEILAGGPLELTVSGFVGTLAHGGALDNQRQDPDLSTDLDFSTDTEVHVLARGEDEETGIEYGGTVEFEADTKVSTKCKLQSNSLLASALACRAARTRSQTPA